VRCDHHDAFLITPADDLEEQMGGIRLKRLIARLADT
jgi:hypothetical protein